MDDVRAPQSPVGRIAHGRQVVTGVERGDSNAWPPHCQAVMIAFLAVRWRSMSRLTCWFVRRRMAAHGRRRRELQPRQAWLGPGSGG